MLKAKRTILANLSLLVVAILWGSGFIATQYAIDAGMSPTLIMSMRFVIATVTLFAAFFKHIFKALKKEILHGCVAGIFLFLGFYLQTIGQAKTTVSNCAFLTATNVIMVPFLVWIFAKKRPDLKVILLTATSLLGVAFLTISFTTGISFGIGDILTTAGAFFFASQIAYLGINCTQLNPRVISFFQLFSAAVISIIALLLFDIKSVNMTQLSQGFLPVLYLGLFPTCICFFLQTNAQKHTKPAVAGVFLSTEGLFGSLFSVILGLEALTVNLVIGGIIITGSVILMSIDFNIFVRNKD